MGVFECPDGYEPITLPNTCELASTVLGIEYSKDDNILDERSVCSQCGFCNTMKSFLNNDYGGGARFICQIEGFATGRYTALDLYSCSWFLSTYLIRI